MQLVFRKAFVIDLSHLGFRRARSLRHRPAQYTTVMESFKLLLLSLVESINPALSMPDYICSHQCSHPTSHKCSQLIHCRLSVSLGEAPVAPVAQVLVVLELAAVVLVLRRKY